MKKLLLVMLCLGFSQAHGVQLLKNKKMTSSELRQFLAASSTKSGKIPSFAKARGSNTEPGGNGPVDLQPVRDAKFKAEVYKMTVQKLSDGSYSVSSSQVCIANGATPVYDARGLTEYNIPASPQETCFTTVGGQAAEIKISAFMSLHNYAIFSDEPATDYKSSFSSFYVTSSANSTGIFASGYASSRELTAKSMILAMGQFPLGLCIDDGNGNVTCENVEGEYFYGTVETLD